MLDINNLIVIKSKVSILIPVYNRERYVSEAIQSSLCQGYKNIEVVIVDNASTDSSWNIIQGFAEVDSRIKAFRNLANVGPVRNWLRCIEEASGEFGKILWSDDLIAPDFIERTLPLLNKDVGFVFTAVNIFSDDNFLDAKPRYLLGRSGLYPSSVYIEKALFGGGVPVSPGCAIFRLDDIRRNLWLQIPNNVQSDFSMHAIGNDLLLFLLTAKDYKYFGYIAEQLSFFRAHDGSITASSHSGKLALHYGMVKAFFVENYYHLDKERLATHLSLLLWRHNDSKRYGLNQVGDFFQADVRVGKYLFARHFISKFLGYSMMVARKLFGSPFWQCKRLKSTSIKSE